MICRFAIWSAVAACLGMPPWAAAQTIEEATGAITLAWDPNADPPAGYLVYVGLEPHNYGETYDVGQKTSFTYSSGIPGERYYFAVAAYDPTEDDVGPASPPISTIIPGAPTTIALHPAQVQGSSVTLRWSNPTSAAIEEYFLEAGSASGLRDLFSGSMGELTSLTAAVAPAQYYVRVRGRTSTGRFVLSNEVSFSTASGECSAPPAIPVGVHGSVSGGEVAKLQWAAVPRATSYYLLIGSAPGLSDLFEGNTGAGSRVTARVATGFKAYARVRAVNACGQSAPSSEVLVR